MKRAIDITTSMASEMTKGNSASASSSRWQPVLKRMASVLVGLSYNLLGFVMLIGFWYFISLITKGELPGPAAFTATVQMVIGCNCYEKAPIVLALANY